ncbi:transporter substrate-binding domain-containing protein [Undibacterium sp. CY18W]|uniref:Transporter substrate-binding domain-containing protein n=1 Tax=Undibacterium hunanense TaxID=2762292 RepID=A0ABR6ZL79_9BURK|nr:transporter substrate-binding domain-containing protein [Undibacterium hunanense]MBC3916666.1 transporter substrate-binding domain-containing protein [Undibacterium hunanense]
MGQQRQYQPVITRPDGKRHLRLVGALLFFCLGSLSVVCQAHDAQLRIAIYENLDYPLNIFDKNHQLTGGLQKEFTDLLAKKISAHASYVAYSRRRIENAVIQGEADLMCYSSPGWFDVPKEVSWSLPTFPQVERVVVMADKPGLENFPQQLEGKKLAVQLGYHYPQIGTQLTEGKIRRVDLTDVPGMFRMLHLGGADAMISSDSEIEGYFKNYPDKRALYKVSKTAFSIVHTQCALSHKSGWKIEQINAAIQSMLDNGDLDKIMRRYGLSSR